MTTTFRLLQWADPRGVALAGNAIGILFDNRAGAAGVAASRGAGTLLSLCPRPRRWRSLNIELNQKLKRIRG
jgi:hypothetical protein